MSDTGFVALGDREISTLNLRFEEYVHEATGARHYHLACEDPNNAFLVAFLTAPQDSTGVAHILEHTSLCGSRRYPVRDPFFMMIRRSLNTFMNAFTASDWTAYPFASQNRKDFDNLLDVYLDAVFFPLLNPLDFAQEGHRIELADPDDPDSPLVYRGVVYNEMKGAMSAPIAQVAQALQSRLFPTVTYHHNSGGDPAAIPDLTYGALRAFHAQHYHPSNAVFMTYGSFPAAEHQERFTARALSEFEALDLDIEIADERRYPAPRQALERYAIELDEAGEDRTHVLLGWLLGKSADVRASMRARLLAGVLLDNSASPLRHLLETTDLGAAPSELCGFDDSTREATFVCGLEGSREERAADVEAVILERLETLARDGVPAEIVESVLHQVELAQREITGGGFPYGLQLMVRALPCALYGSDPFEALDIDPVLEELRREARSPDLIPGLLRELLLDNPHRVRLTMIPDSERADELARAEQARLASVRAALDAGGLARIRTEAEQLRARQESKDDPELLPKVSITDIPPDLNVPEGRPEVLGRLPVTWYHPGTNGLVYLQLIVDLPDLDEHELEHLPLLCDFFTDVGCGEKSYLDVQAWQSAVTGGIRSRTSLRTSVEDVGRHRGYFVLAAKSLARNQQAMQELLRATFTGVRFDEHERLRELVTQARLHAESQVTDHGHSLALAAASARTSVCAALEHRWGGLLGLQALKHLDDGLESGAALGRFADALAALAARLRTAPRRMLAVSEQGQADAIRAALEADWGADAGSGQGSGDLRRFREGFRTGRVREAWTTSTQVSFCAKAFPTVAQGHPDAPALRVLGPCLRNGYLHRTVREQGGAYGAGAGYSADAGAFRFYSYRDPRLAETLHDFDRSVAWLLDGGLDDRDGDRLLEEAVLGVVGEIDRPDSPAGDATIAYFGALHGRTPEQRREFRRAVLDVSLDDLRAVAERYLTGDEASVAVVTSSAILERQSDPEVAELTRIPT